MTAAVGQAALQIENRRLRGREADESYTPRDSVAQGLVWQDEPAVYCPACSLVWSPETRQCSCGTAATAAALPLFVQGKFRLERLVGAGGMGIVYLAVDMVLDRQVAIKTLPSLRSESADRLHREARTMARVLHPNLALIYGAEQWRGTPMLIVEYLDGGTLRDWIRRGPVPYAEAIDLGIVLADVLDRVARLRSAAPRREAEQHRLHQRTADQSCSTSGWPCWMGPGNPAPGRSRCRAARRKRCSGRMTRPPP